MGDSIAGTPDTLDAGDRIEFISDDGVAWSATVLTVEPGDSSHVHQWVRLRWDDGMSDPSRWAWPAADLYRLS